MILIKPCSKIFLAVTVSALCVPSALGYIDPGTGGLVLGSAWGMVVGFFGAVAAFVLLRFVKPLRNHIRRLMRRKNHENP